MSTDNSFLYDFIVETKENLSTIEEDLLDLERSKEHVDPDLINKIFRVIHNVKGTAGFVGLKALADLAHRMETVFSMIRAGELCPQTDMIDALLEGADTIHTMLDDIDNSNDLNCTNILSRLESFIEGKQPEAPVQVSDSSGDEHKFEVNHFIVEQLAPEFKYFYLIKYDLSELSKEGEKTPVDLVRQLLSAGVILDAKLEDPEDNLRDSMPEGSLLYKVVYATVIGTEFIERFSKAKKDRINQLQREDLVKDEKVSVEKVETESKTELKAVKLKEEPVTPEVIQETITEEIKKTTETEVAKPTLVKKETPLKVGDVSNETIRINVKVIDKLMRLAGELVLVRNQQLLSLDSSENKASSQNNVSIQRLDIITSDLQETVMSSRMQPIGNVFNKFPRLVRDLSSKLSKDINLQIIGNEVELDKTLVETLADPLTHLMRNCCDHGLESPAEREKSGKSRKGTVTLKAYHEGGQINIEIKDDGKGIDLEAIKKNTIKKGLKTESDLAQLNDKEILQLILLPGTSTATKVSDVSGRGVGMDVVKTGIEEMGGTLEIDTTPGKGTAFYMRLPLTLAIIPCLIVISGEHKYAIPQINLEECVCLYDEEVLTKIECAGNREIYRLRNKLMPMVRLNEVLDRPEIFTEDDWADIKTKYHNETNKKKARYLNFAVLKVGSSRFGLIVDEILGTEEIVVKPMHPSVKFLSCYAGATIMGDGKVALILDIQNITNHAKIAMEKKIDKMATETVSQSNTQAVLLFTCGGTEQLSLPLPAIKRIEKIKMSAIEKVKDKEFITIDDVSTSVLRLNSYLKLSEGEDKEDMYLIIPKHAEHPFGILANTLINIEDCPMELNKTSYADDIIPGTLLIHKKMTLFLDPDSLALKADFNKNSEKGNSELADDGSADIHEPIAA